MAPVLNSGGRWYKLKAARRLCAWRQPLGLPASQIRLNVAVTLLTNSITVHQIYPVLTARRSDTRNLDLAIQMVCFCFIPAFFYRLLRRHNRLSFIRVQSVFSPFWDNSVRWPLRSSCRHPQLGPRPLSRTSFSSSPDHNHPPRGRTPYPSPSLVNHA